MYFTVPFAEEARIVYIMEQTNLINLCIIMIVGLIGQRLFVVTSISIDALFVSFG